MSKVQKVAGCVLAASLWACVSGGTAATNGVAVPATGGPAIGAASVTTASAARRDPALVKKQYEAVAGHLDQGGDLFLIANVDGLVEKAAEWIRTLVATTTASETNAVAVRNAVNKLPGFLRRNGFYAVHGFGMSVVPRADGLNDLKSYISRDPAAANLPLWRSFVSNRPRRMACLDMLPADVALFQTMTVDPATLWTMVKQGVAEVGGPDAALAFNKSLDGLAKKTGASLGTILASLGDEGFYAVRVPVKPAATAAAAAPAPGFMPPMPWGDLTGFAGVAVKDDTLFNILSNKLTKAQHPFAVTNIGGAVVLKAGAPGGALPVAPCIAKVSGYLLVALDEKTLVAALGAMARKNGLVATAEFKKAFAGRSLINSGMGYSTPKFMEAIMALQDQAMAMAGAGAGMHGAPDFSAFQKLLLGERNQMTATVTTVAPDGILTAGVSSMTGRDMVASMAMAPMGFVAAMAIPSFMHARTASAGNACINNLRILDAAKEQWAMEKTKNAGDEPELQGVLQYVKGAKMPVCPQGGTYTLNAIGAPPTCSHPGHELP